MEKSNETREEMFLSPNQILWRRKLKSPTFWGVVAMCICSIIILIGSMITIFPKHKLEYYMTHEINEELELMYSEQDWELIEIKELKDARGQEIYDDGAKGIAYNVTIYVINHENKVEKKELFACAYYWYERGRLFCNGYYCVNDCDLVEYV